MVFIIGISLLRLVFGPLPESLCWLLIFSNQSIGIFIFLVLDANYLARVIIISTTAIQILKITFQYIYAVVIKSATICNDDLIGAFIFFEIITFSVIGGFLHMMSPGKFAINYYICTGENPEPFQNMKSKVFYPNILFAIL